MNSQHGVIEGEPSAMKRAWMRQMKKQIKDKKRRDNMPQTDEQLASDAGAIEFVRQMREAERAAGTRAPELTWFQVGDVSILL